MLDFQAYKYHRQHGHSPAVAKAFAAVDAETAKTRYPRSIGGGNRPFKRGYSTYLWIEDARAVGVRNMRFADEVASLRHKGWFVDEFQDEVYRGAVLQLPARSGKTQYLAGYADPNNVGAYLVEFDIIEDEREAARRADRIAEIFAESEREHNEAWRALVNAREDLSAARIVVRECIDDIRDVRDCCTPNVRLAVRHQGRFDAAWDAYVTARDKALEARSDARRLNISWHDCAP